MKLKKHSLKFYILNRNRAELLHILLGLYINDDNVVLVDASHFAGGDINGSMAK